LSGPGTPDKIHHRIDHHPYTTRVLFCFPFASDIIILIIAWCWNNSLPLDLLPCRLSICSISQRRDVQNPETKCPRVQNPKSGIYMAGVGGDGWGNRHATWTCTLQDNHIKKRASQNPHPSVQSGNRWQIRALVPVAMHHPSEPGMPNWHLYQELFVLSWI